MSGRQIFIDIDGVLADFVSAAHECHGASYNPDTYPRLEWSIANVLGITEAKFWEKIDASAPDFWPNLKPYPWFTKLLTAANCRGVVTLLSSPSLHPSSHYGKRQWVDRHAKSFELILCKSKHLLSGPGRILIDDNDGNCEKWRAAGGIAILFPQPWNKNHHCMRDSVGHALEQLDFFLDDRQISDRNKSKTLVPADAKTRKSLPVCTGVLDYFPDALLAIADVSRRGNEQHNPGQPLHWAKEKSTDEADALARHLLDRGKFDADGVRHSAKIAWRALALLQRELDAANGTAVTP